MPFQTTSEASVHSSPRAVCLRCRRPEAFCWCAHLTTIDTRTRVVLLQHPRERDVPIGTARMATLCLPNSELHVGVEWGTSTALARALSDPARPAALLYPGDGAVDVSAHPPDGPITLVVVDGTWSQTRKVLRSNPALAALPRYAFRPPEPSQYTIRREPRAECVSTVEALVYVLGALEGDPARFLAMLAPFRAMVSAQVHCQQTLRQGRVRHPKGPRPAPTARANPLRDHLGDLVCVAGEASAWPRDEAARRPVEVVQWVAWRQSTGERFEAFARPTESLAPATAWQTGVAASVFAEAPPREALLAAWRAFVRDDDLVCAWGEYPTTILAGAGGFLPAARVDVRKLARGYAKGSVGAAEDFLARIGAPVADDARMGLGRAGARLAHLVAAVQQLVDA